MYFWALIRKIQVPSIISGVRLKKSSWQKAKKIPIWADSDVSEDSIWLVADYWNYFWRLPGRGRIMHTPWGASGGKAEYMYIFKRSLFRDSSLEIIAIPNISQSSWRDLKSQSKMNAKEVCHCSVTVIPSNSFSKRIRYDSEIIKTCSSDFKDTLCSLVTVKVSHQL